MSSRCFSHNCNDKTDRGLSERFNKHSGKDFNSQIFKHSIEADHPPLTLETFQILNAEYSYKMPKCLRGKSSE